MIITQNTNISATLELEVEGIKSPVVSVNSKLVQDGRNFNIGFSIMDSASLDENIAEIQAQLDGFMSTIRLKMVELGYKIKI